MTFFEVFGMFAVLLFALTGFTLYLYCTAIGLKVVWRRLMQIEQEARTVQVVSHQLK